MLRLNDSSYSYRESEYDEAVHFCVDFKELLIRDMNCSCLPYEVVCFVLAVELGFRVFGRFIHLIALCRSVSSVRCFVWATSDAVTWKDLPTLE